jgi:hypothetical protein
MTKYEIARDNGQIGHDNDNIKATINLGLKKGYEGFSQEKKEVLDFLTDLYRSGFTQVPFVVKDTVITYAYPGDDGLVACHEPALELSSDKSPLYAKDLSREAWKELVEKEEKKRGERGKKGRGEGKEEKGEKKRGKKGEKLKVKAVT